MIHTFNFLERFIKKWQIQVIWLVLFQNSLTKYNTALTTSLFDIFPTSINPLNTSNFELSFRCFAVRISSVFGFVATADEAFEALLGSVADERGSADLCVADYV